MRSYAEFLAAILAAGSFREALVVLEAAVKNPDVRPRIARDFQPTVGYVRRLLYSLDHLRTGPSRDRATEDRATRLIAALVCGASLTAGRPPKLPLTPEQQVAASITRSNLYADLGPIWVAATGRRRRLIAGIEALMASRMRWTTAHHTQLEALVMQNSRPGVIADHLAAWQLGLSVADVKRARTAPTALYA